MSQSARNSPSVWAQALGYGGLLPLATGLLLLAVVLWLCFAVNRVDYPGPGLQAWVPMRLLLTTVASACCVAGGALHRVEHIAQIKSQGANCHW
jgi:hypothetical protein